MSAKARMEGDLLWVPINLLESMILPFFDTRVVLQDLIKVICQLDACEPLGLTTVPSCTFPRSIKSVDQGLDLVENHCIMPGLSSP